MSINCAFVGSLYKINRILDTAAGETRDLQTGYLQLPHTAFQHTSDIYLHSSSTLTLLSLFTHVTTDFMTKSYHLCHSTIRHLWVTLRRMLYIYKHKHLLSQRLISETRALDLVP